MATTTTNYGFDIPQSTDLVKDGATAIATLGQDIDTAMFTALGTNKAGMVLLNTTSFSAVSGISFAANTFTSTYNNYRIIFSKLIASGNVDTYMRLRAAGSDNTTSNYSWSYTGARSNNTTFSNGGAAQSFFNIGSTRSVEYGGFSLDLYSPQSTQFTGLTAQWNGGETSHSNFGTTGGCFTATTSFDSASFYLSSGTWTGSYSVFGYNL
jgi:hypothetical protein